MPVVFTDGQACSERHGACCPVLYCRNKHASSAPDGHVLLLPVSDDFAQEAGRAQNVLRISKFDEPPCAGRAFQSVDAFLKTCSRLGRMVDVSAGFRIRKFYVVEMGAAEPGGDGSDVFRRGDVSPEYTGRGRGVPDIDGGRGSGDIEEMEEGFRRADEAEGQVFQADLYAQRTCMAHYFGKKGFTVRQTCLFQSPPIAETQVYDDGFSSDFMKKVEHAADLGG